MAKEKSRADQLRDMINKAAGQVLSHNLMKENPTEVKDWISTGTRLLDSIICKGMVTGIPAGKIVELAGLPSTGKSYLALQIAKNAIDKDYDVVYFDSENAIDPSFIMRMGLDPEKIIYTQATSVEMVLETVEMLLKSDSNPKLFIWDSLAMTACKSDIETDFDPGRSVGLRPRILSKGFKKLTIPLGNHGSTLLVLNQLYTYIPSGPGDYIQAKITPYVAPGGNALRHSYSLAIWLTSRTSKGSFVYNEHNEVVGTEVKATVEKSRFGTYKRSCVFNILWGTGDVKIDDEDSWFEVLEKSPRFVKRSPKSHIWELTLKSGEVVEIKKSKWKEHLKDEETCKKIFEVMDEVLLDKNQPLALNSEAEIEENK